MRRQILFVDGYNMIGSWEHLVRLKRLDFMEEAREVLISQLSDYSKYRHINIILVFDAHQVSGMEQVYKQNNITIVFTNENETADMYIEREIKHYRNSVTHISVASSDAIEQWIIFQQGAIRLSADELWLNMKHAKKDIHKDIRAYHNDAPKRYHWPEDQLAKLQRLQQTFDDKHAH